MRGGNERFVSRVCRAFGVASCDADRTTASPSALTFVSTTSFTEIAPSRYVRSRLAHELRRLFWRFPDPALRIRARILGWLRVARTTRRSHLTVSATVTCNNTINVRHRHTAVCAVRTPPRQPALRLLAASARGLPVEHASAPR